MSFRALALSALAVLVAPDLRAQGRGVAMAVPLSIPGGDRFLCRPAPLSNSQFGLSPASQMRPPADKVARVYRITPAALRSWSPIWDREIVLVTDSAGRAEELSDVISRGPRGQTAVALSFVPGRQGLSWFETTVYSAAMARAFARGGSPDATMGAVRTGAPRSLTSGEVTQAQRLARCLWQQPCSPRPA